MMADRRWYDRVNDTGLTPRASRAVRPAVSFDRIDAVLSEAVESGRVPGVVAVVATREGPVHAAAFGVDAPDTGRPLAQDSIFRLASMTKLFTAVAVLQLVDRGALALDDPVGRFIPAFDELPVFAWNGDEVEYRPPASRPTVRQLLAHTSGLAYELWNDDVFRLYERTGIPGIATGLRDTLKTPLFCDPGTRVEYGSGMDWAGQVVEAVTGRRLDAYIDEAISRPLGLRDTSMTLDAGGRARCGPVLHREPDGTFSVTEAGYPPEPEFVTGGGILYSTAPDFLRLQRALLHDGELDGVRILSRQSVDEIFAEQSGALDIPVMPSSVPFLSADVPFPPGWAWGLGLAVNRAASPQGRSAGSGGWAGIFNTFFWVDREAGIAAGLFMQYIPFVDDVAVDLHRRFERAVYDALS
jgi:methyl acetate hydrolase